MKPVPGTFSIAFTGVILHMYNEYFGLKEAPFNVTPDPRFIFFSAKHLDAFSSLVYGIESRKGFILITGDIGAGKTTICRGALEKLKGRAHTAMILNPCLSEMLLLRAITEDFGIEVKARNKKDCFDALNRFVLDAFHKGMNTVLVIDESQDLAPRVLEQIRLLSNLETNSEKLLQIVLVGQPELRTTLNKPSLLQLNQRIQVRFHLTSLDQTETGEYICHRLKVAGLPEGLSPFTPEAIQFIYNQTLGVPRLINRICDLALLAAYARNIRQIDNLLVEDAHAEMSGVTVS